MTVVDRLVDAPIVDATSDSSIGTNIQGPSLIRVPDWVREPLGRYYLYFADHKGAFIRLAHAEQLTGPWTVHRPGSLGLAASHFATENLSLDDATVARYREHYREALGETMPVDIRDDLVTAHIASPDVHVDHDRHEIVMFFHGLAGLVISGPGWRCRATVLHSAPLGLCSGPRTSVCSGTTAGGTAMPGRLLRSADGRRNFERGPSLFEPTMRHSAVRVVDGTLEVFWTRVGARRSGSCEAGLHSTATGQTGGRLRRRDPAARTALGRSGTAARTVPPRCGARPRQPAARPVCVRGGRAVVPALCGGW